MQNSIFGIEAPQFEADSEIILLDHVVIERANDSFYYGDIIHESVFNRYIVWTDMGDHFNFRLLMYLFKYDNPQEKYDELKLYHRSLVKLWRRRDGQPFRNNNDEIVLFRFDQMNESFLHNVKYPDVLTLVFKSQDPIDISKTLVSYGS
ncbi:MAG: hypothetical protein KGZ85_08085 [Ignavibacterium sp.]|nr:hypothetical protein [Ignavibacterium sp.]